MSVNQQAQTALDQAKKLVDDANAVKSKSLADAKAIVATAAAGAKSFDPSKPLPSPAQTPSRFNPNIAPGRPEPPATAIKKEEKPSAGKYVYSVFHTVMSIVAIFLSYRCNGCFQWIPFLAALCCPYAYIIYIIIFKSQCLSTSFIEPICGPEVVYVQSPQYPSYAPMPQPSYGYNTAPPSYGYNTAPPSYASMPSTI